MGLKGGYSATSKQVLEVKQENGLIKPHWCRDHEKSVSGMGFGCKFESKNKGGRICGGGGEGGYCLLSISD